MKDKEFDPELLKKSQPFENYKRAFIQRLPRYAVKRLGSGSWRTKNKPLSDTPIMAHLAGKYYVAVLGKWYPEHAILDIDSRGRSEAEEIRSQLELDEGSSIFLSSESPDSFHLLIRPEYYSKPPTLNLLKDVLTPFCRANRIEIYPQRGRPMRLPFSPHLPALDPEYAFLGSWEAQLYHFEKLDPLDLSTIKYHQLIFDFAPGPGKLLLPTNIFQDVQDLLDYGLQLSSTRHESQGRILFFLLRQNVPKENAIEIVWEWIRQKHNGFSKDILKSPRYVRHDIESQAAFYWSKCELSQFYPDSTHNLFRGYITKPDIPEIVEATAGSLPRMRFLYSLVKFSYPRRHRKLISIHTDRLIEWSSNETYQKYLNELGNKGIAERGSEFRPGRFSKDLKLNWKFRSSSEAVLYEGRSIDSFEDTIRLLFKDKPDEFRQLLEKAGTPRRSRYTIMKSIWRGF